MLFKYESVVVPISFIAIILIFSWYTLKRIFFPFLSDLFMRWYILTSMSHFTAWHINEVSSHFEIWISCLSTQWSLKCLSWFHLFPLNIVLESYRLKHDRGILAFRCLIFEGKKRKHINSNNSSKTESAFCTRVTLILPHKCPSSKQKKTICWLLRWFHYCPDSHKGAGVVLLRENNTITLELYSDFASTLFISQWADQKHIWYWEG